MPFNGSGVYTPPVADFPVVTNTVISSTHFNNTINDIATGISNCIAKDGQSTPTANIKFGGFKLTGVGAPTVTNDALTFGQPGTMTTLTATTSVVTPLVSSSSGTLNFSVSGLVSQWEIDVFPALFPTTDQGSDIGKTGNRVRQVFTPIIDSGTTGSLSLRTNNGSEFLRGVNSGSPVNYISIVGGASGVYPIIRGDGTDAAVGLRVTVVGTGDIVFTHSNTTEESLRLPRVAGATRAVTISGSNGGNPTISTTAGNLNFGTLPVSSQGFAAGGTFAGAGNFRSDYVSTVLTARNNANSGDVTLTGIGTTNGVVDVVSMGTNGAGLIMKARSGGAAPTTSDLASGFFTVWRDTGGATTKIYYNNAGTIQSATLS